MRKVDSDRIQSFHMQALRCILGIRWYDKVSNAVVNERTKLPDFVKLSHNGASDAQASVYLCVGVAIRVYIRAKVCKPLLLDCQYGLFLEQLQFQYFGTGVSSLIADRHHSLFGHICRLPENTPASQALQLSIEAHTGTPPAAGWKRPPGRPQRNWPICWCCSDRGPGSFDVEDAMTLSWSSAAVSELVSFSAATLLVESSDP